LTRKKNGKYKKPKMGRQCTTNFNSILPHIRIAFQIKCTGMPHR